MDAELVSFLKKGANYPWHMGKVRLIQTHISYVFLGEDIVFKVKKPVTFPFLDFSTLAKRKNAVEEEFRINQRLTKGIYLEVLPLYKDTKGNLSFKNIGKIVDYGLKMKRFPDDSQLSLRLEKGTVGKRELKAISNRLSKFYQIQSQSPLKTFRPKKLIQDNLNQAKLAIQEPGEMIKLDWVNQAQNSYFQKNKLLIQARIKEGKIVDGHGDLHAEHILFNQDGTVSVFDAIEFKAAFREADWAYDISFLVMDLWARGFPLLAVEFLKAMEAQLMDTTMRGLMPSFCAHRATIRAKANGLKALEAEVPSKERQVAAQASRHYLSQALVFAYLGFQPHWLVLMGPIASGKSTVAAHLAEVLRIPHLNSDVLRKELFGMKPTEDGNSRAGDLYSPKASDATYAGLIQKATEAAQQGQSVVLDGTWHQQSRRETLRAAAQKAGVKLVMWECQEIQTTLKKRLKQREKEPSVSDARLSLLEEFMKKYEAPQEEESVFSLLPMSLEKRLDELFTTLLPKGDTQQ